jgi:hypothetical protein
VLRILVLPALAVAGVFVSVAMVVIGLPEANAMQSVLLELSSLPLSFSVAVGIVLLQQRAVRPMGRRSRMVFQSGLALVALGLVLMFWAYLPGPRGLVHTGQLVVWIGLLAALVMVIRRLPRRRHSTYHVVERDNGEAALEDPADREQTPSL